MVNAISYCDKPDLAAVPDGTELYPDHQRHRLKGNLSPHIHFNLNIDTHKPSQYDTEVPLSPNPPRQPPSKASVSNAPPAARPAEWGSGGRGGARDAGCVGIGEPQWPPMHAESGSCSAEETEALG